MRCIKCNYDNLEGMKYCVSCGAELITRDEKLKRQAEGEKSISKLYKIIKILLVVLAIVAVIFVVVKVFTGKEDIQESDNDTPTVSVKVNQDTVGVWKCDTQKFSEDNAISIVLQSDGVFKFGPIGGLKDNRIEGSFSSDTFEAKDETGQYDLYQVVMNTNLEVENGVEKQVEKMVVFTLAIDSQTATRGIFSPGEEGQSTYYCSR